MVSMTVCPLPEALLSGVAPTLSQAAADRDANQRASVLLDELPTDARDALERLCARLRPLLSERYARLLTIESLVAAQPNLHNGRDYLRPHLDEPLHDGFGVVIVTLAIRGRAQIVLKAQPWDAALRQDYCFPLQVRGGTTGCASDGGSR